MLPTPSASANAASATTARVARASVAGIRVIAAGFATASRRSAAVGRATIIASGRWTIISLRPAVRPCALASQRRHPQRAPGRSIRSMNKAFTREDDDDVDDDVEEASPLPAGARNYMTPGGFARLKAELERAGREGTARARRDRSVGGEQRRPLRERRLHLRQEAPARNRPAHPFPDPASRHRRGRRSAGAPRRRRRRPDILRRDGDRARFARRNAHGEHRRRRRDRHRTRLHQLGVADGARADQGARRRHGDAATRRAASKSSKFSKCATSRWTRHDGSAAPLTRSEA